MMDMLTNIFKTLPGLPTDKQSYPPFNMKKIDENKFVMEFAVAGFAKTELEVEIDGTNLIVNGKSESAEIPDNILYKGISSRPFSRTFSFNDGIVFKDAMFVNGMLKVFMDRLPVEPKKPTKMPITG